MKILNETKKLVKEEQRLAGKIIANLAIIENRKLYVEVGHRSLFQYCEKELGYSKMQASIRVNCVKMINKHPALEEKLDSGQINPSTLAAVERHGQNNELNKKDEEQVIKSVEGKTYREAINELEKDSEQRGRAVTRVETITLRERVLKKLDRIADSFPGDLNSYEIISALVDEKIEEIERSKQKRTSRGSKRQRYISREVKEAVNARARGQCEFRNKNGKRCKCRHDLQFDHIRSIAAGGSSNEENIQKLCHAHNSYRAVRDGLRPQKFHSTFARKQFSGYPVDLFTKVLD